ncbi:hypothetical protein EGW08_004032 [Elysia chlorotica]|uniref:Reverse transcriptase domain-containing protein n=1 Tax=Elysia chlorotica TaxID=188477 RepID=A0A3S1CBH8_ELYCH|nr:hypothetical protein EGW08_004032 [Elysia chlorotica]
MMFSAMLTDAFNVDTPGIDIRYRIDGKLYHPRRLQANTKVHAVKLCDFLFADDCALNARNESDMQHRMNLFSTACVNFGLTISTKKTKVMYQPAPGKPYTESIGSMNGVKLAAVDRFTYLGSTLSRNVHIDDEIDGRIAKASVVFGRLRFSVWDSEAVSQITKIKVFRAVVLSTLLHLVRACCGLRSLPQVNINYALDTLPTQSEVEKAIDQLSSGKAHGADSIPAEVYKHGGPLMREKVTELFQTMWAQGTIPQNFYRPSLQEERKSSVMRQSQRNITSLHCRENPR